jgi:hypothetical protein
MSDILKQAIEMAETKLAVEREHAAAAVVRNVLDDDDLIDDYVQSVDAGVTAAIEETDEATLQTVVVAIREAAQVKVEAQSKRLALQMIRDLAADNKKEEHVPF